MRGFSMADHGTRTVVPMLLEGVFAPGSGSSFRLADPISGIMRWDVPHASISELDLAVASAHNAWSSWLKRPWQDRQLLMCNVVQLLRQKTELLTQTLSMETGRTLRDCRNEVQTGIEHVLNALSQLNSPGTAARTPILLQPLGVCLVLAPVSYPVLFALATFPLALLAGNTCIIKPSEFTPQSIIKLAELLIEAGIPPGVLQVVHGRESEVTALIEHPDVRAVSSAGSSASAFSIQQLAARHGKRYQCLASTRNHVVVMPDAAFEQIVQDLATSTCLRAGQNCMAWSSALLVGKADELLDDLVDLFEEIHVGPPSSSLARCGPLAASRYWEQSLDAIQDALEEGAIGLVDGRDCHVAGFEDGYWIGPTLFSSVQTDMRLYREDLPGPILSCLHVSDLQEAINIMNTQPNILVSSIYTSDATQARNFAGQIQCGLISVNQPVFYPAPLSGSLGWKKTFFGDIQPFGPHAMDFYIQHQTIMERWS